MSTKNPNIVPGWKMTKAQIYGNGANGSQPGYFAMFTQVCRAKDWKGNTAQMTDYRRQWHILAGLGDVSAKTIDRMRGFDALKASWLALTRPADLNAQLRMQDMPRIRLITRIREMCHEDFWRPLLESSRFRASDLEDLSEIELEQFRNTLDARIRAAQANVPAEAAMSNFPATNETEKSDMPEREHAHAGGDGDNEPF